MKAKYPLVARVAARYPRSWRFLARRIAPGEYLGLHLTVGLAISALALWAFAAITEDVVRQESLTRIDSALGVWLHAHASAAGHLAALTASAVGGPSAVSLLAVGIGALLASQRRWLQLEGWIIALLGGELLNQLLKDLIHRPRPEHATLMHSWSFPSGHAMGALVGYGMLAYLFIVLVPSAGHVRAAIVLATALLIFAIGVSRLYLGVHYFTDVLGGYCAGALWLATCISGLEVLRRARAQPGPAAALSS